MDSDIHVLTWDPVCQRSTSIAAQLRQPLETIHYLSYRRPWIAPVKYPLQAATTLRSLFRRRPRTVMVSNPPPFAAACVWLYSALTGGNFVVDAHTGVFLEPKWRPFRPINRFLMRRAALTLVTNEALQQQVQDWGGRAFVLPDPLPPMTRPAERFPLDRRQFNIAAIFSFYEDEPIDEMLAVRNLPSDVQIYITGDASRVSRQTRDRLSAQLTLCGFIPRAQYDALLWQCDAVIVLCTRPHTLLCGAYEAVAAGKPVMTSRSEAMQRYFRAGTVVVENTTQGIEDGIAMLRGRCSELTRAVIELRGQLEHEWRQTFARCLEAIDE